MILVNKMNYWQRREKKQQDLLFDKSYAATNKKLAALFRSVEKDVSILIQDLYLKIVNDNGEVLMSELYRFNRYYHLKKSINEKLKVLGEEELDEIGRSIENLYKWSSTQTLSKVGFFDSIDAAAANEVISTLWEANGKYWSKNIWCADGKTSADRVNKTMARLQSTLEKGMIDCIARGASKEELIKTLKKRFGVAFSDADRLARTELTYIQNQATKDSYKKAGIKKYRYLAATDERTSEICKNLNGKTFPLEAAAVGVNYPPMHANCRCTTVAVIE